MVDIFQCCVAFHSTRLMRKFELLLGDVHCFALSFPHSLDPSWISVYAVAWPNGGVFEAFTDEIIQ